MRFIDTCTTSPRHLSVRRLQSINSYMSFVVFTELARSSRRAVRTVPAGASKRANKLHLPPLHVHCRLVKTGKLQQGLVRRYSTRDESQTIRTLRPNPSHTYSPLSHTSVVSSCSVMYPLGLVFCAVRCSVAVPSPRQNAVGSFPRILQHWRRGVTYKKAGERLTTH